MKILSERWANQYKIDPRDFILDGGTLPNVGRVLEVEPVPYDRVKHGYKAVAVTFDDSEEKCVQDPDAPIIISGISGKTTNGISITNLWYFGGQLWRRKWDHLNWDKARIDGTVKITLIRQIAQYPTYPT